MMQPAPNSSDAAGRSCNRWRVPFRTTSSVMGFWPPNRCGTFPHDEESEYKVGACPSVEDLKQLVLGQIADSAAEALERHLAECQRCCETLHTLKLKAQGT